MNGHAWFIDSKIVTFINEFFLLLFFFIFFIILQAESDQSSEKSKFVEIDLPSPTAEHHSIKSSFISTARRLSPSYIEIAQALMGSKRDTLLKIVESDDDESWKIWHKYSSFEENDKKKNMMTEDWQYLAPLIIIALSSLPSNQLSS